MNRKQIAIVTGGAGFIGSHLVDLLIKNNFIVRVIDDFSGGHEKNLKQHINNNSLFVEKINICNLKNNHSIFKDVDYIYHFAGKGDIVPSIEQPYEYLNTNVLGTVNILEGAKNMNIKKFVYAASSSCYGLAETPTRETNKIQTLYPYALSKYQGEQCVMHWHRVYGLSTISLRIFNAYGERVRTTGAYGAVFGVFFKQKLEKKPFTVVGDGNQKRDFLYVKDVAKAFFAASQSSKSGEIYNLGAGSPQTINKLVELIGNENGKINIPERPGEPNCTWADITKIKKDLNWFPEISFDEGVSLMMKTIDEWKDAPLWDTDSIEEATKTWFKFMKQN